jgi:DNA-binding NarL/FixJ family response regulator
VNETAAKAQGDPLRILVVDDNPHVLSALIDLLEEEGDVCVVGAALRVDDAITLALAKAPDAVLVDVNMPGGGGQKVIAAIRGVLPDVRIVALSAYLDQGSVKRMLSTGADMCFSKSADISSVIRSLTR